jgi:hypothetical protein
MNLTSVRLAVLLLAAPALAAAQGATMVRVTQTAAIVEQPDGGSAAVGTANPGEVLEVLDERNGWLLVRPPAGSSQAWKTGWINASSTQPVAGSTSPVATAAEAPPPQSPGARKGFIIGLGGGIGMHRAAERTFFIRGIPFGGETTNSVGVATEFDIGYAPTDQLLIYYANSIQFSNNETYDIVGLTGVGVTYALKPRAPSWYVNGAIGGATGAEVDFNSGSFGSVERGIAYKAGGGYEFARHWFLGGDAMFLKLDGLTHTVLRGTITWIFY